ncbi:MAG: hypothetical protein ACLU8D_12030 [Enterocloster sp.]
MARSYGSGGSRNGRPVDYYVGEDLVASFPVTASETVGKWDLEFCVKTLLNGFLFCYNG